MNGLARHGAGAADMATVEAVDTAWRGDATSVHEFLRPLREQLDAPGVLEVCVNRPGEMLVESASGWTAVPAPTLTLERCHSLATAVATWSDQQINPERPLLAATLPSGERVQFVVPPAVTRGTVSITIRKPADVIRRLADFEREGLFERTAIVSHAAGSDLLPFEQELVALKAERRFPDFLRLAVQRHQTIVVSGRTGSGKTTFMKGLVEEVPRHERLVTIEDTAELMLPRHPNVVHLYYSKDGQGTARVTAKTLLEACLRMKPDRIFLAEVRGDECFHFVRLAASGHPGSITSVHAGSCALAFEQMALLIRESGAGGGLRLHEIKWLLRVVVDVVVQIDRDDRGRFVSELYYEPRRQRLARWDDAMHGAPA
jgi:type IV secretion system protein VirB11